MSVKGIARVASLYGQVERVRLVELQQASAAVLEVEQARALAAALVAQRRDEGRGALAMGELLGWRIAASACDAAERMAEQAETLRVEREAIRAEAGVEYRASRLQTQRVARVLEGLEEAERVREDRAEQAGADDRYAARMCWTRMKAG